MKVSVICVYNNSMQLEEQLLKSLQMQDLDYEFIPIDNSSNRFKSAASALNYGASISTGDVLIFSHQDIFFKETCSLSNFSQEVFKSNIGDITGAVGVRERSYLYLSNMTEGNILDIQLINILKNQLYEVATVDECFFGMRRETWDKLRFNEIICDNWHLYCVEMCLHSRKNGGRVFVYPIQLHHYSKGQISVGYMKNLQKLCKFYRHSFKYVWTTCYKVRTSPFYINSLYFIWRANRFLKSIFIIFCR